MDTFPLLNLPKDLIGLLLNDYFDLIASLRCLQVCVKLNELGDRSKIIYRVLIYRMKVEYQEQFNQLILCPICFINLENEKILKKHIHKHEVLKKKNRKMPCHNPFKTDSCYYCGVIDSNLTNHRCLLQSKCCYNGGVENFSHGLKLYVGKVTGTELILI